MIKELLLTDKEAQLVLELLEAQDQRLPVMIHHSDTFAVRAALRSRRRAVERLIERLRAAVAEAHEHDALKA